MPTTNTNFALDAKERLKAGVDQLANSVIVTLGNFGKNVLFVDQYGVTRSTKDGVTVAKSIQEFKDPVANIGANLVKMAAIKASEKVGDGTTTSTLLAQNLINRGLDLLKSKNNAVAVKRGMDVGCQQVVEQLKANSRKITDNAQLKQVAFISSNGDEEISKLVSQALIEVGIEGVVTVEESRTGETSLELVEGIQLEKGYKSPFFVTNNDLMQCVLDDPYILLYDKKIVQVKELLPVLEACSTKNKSLLIIAEDIDGEALATLLMNKVRGILKICAVKAPDFGDRRLHILEDVAILTGGTVISPEKGMKLDKITIEMLGECRKATISKEITTIIDGKGQEELIVERVNSIKAQIDNMKSSYEIEKLQDRLSKMLGGVAIINIGGSNEVEAKEKKDRVDDALQATKCALEEGISMGGGVALVKTLASINTEGMSVDEVLGAEILKSSISTPYFQIMRNAGLADEDIYPLYSRTKSMPLWEGILSDGKEINLFDAGIIDPTKVTRVALESACGVAGIFLTTECVITQEKEKSDTQMPQMPSYGDM